MPKLRIVADELCTAAHARRAESKRTYLRRTDRRGWRRPINGLKSKYLLTGLASCGICGGSLTPQSRSHGRKRFYYYQCLVHVTRRPKVCANSELVALTEAEAAVRATFEQHLLRTDIVRDALAEEVEVLVPDGGDVAARRLGLEERLQMIESELGRMTDAIVAGVPKVRELAERITAKDHERTQLQSALQALDQLAQAAKLDVADVSAKLGTILNGWRDPLGGDVAQARQVLRKLLAGRLVFKPTTTADGARMYEFTGHGVLDPIVAGAMPTLFNNSDDLKHWWPQRDTNPFVLWNSAGL